MLNRHSICNAVKNTLLNTGFSAILPAGMVIQFQIVLSQLINVLCDLLIIIFLKCVRYNCKSFHELK